MAAIVLLNDSGLTESKAERVDERLRCWQRFDLFKAKWLYWMGDEFVSDLRYHYEAQNRIRARIHDDYEFSEMVEIMKFQLEREQEEEDNEGIANVIAHAIDMANEDTDIQERIGLINESREVLLPHIRHHRRCTRKRRRRKRVVAYCVVALVNKLKSKYYCLSDCEANRRLVGHYLLKLMKEHNFRTTDIEQHVHYAVKWYFDTSGQLLTTKWIRE